MVRLAPFEVERWMDEYERTPGVINIAETCAASISIDELVALSEDKSGKSPIDTSTCLVYGAIPGSEALRSNIASQHENLSSENVLITQGAIAANFLTLYALVGPGDHVICVYPTYQQLYSVPRSLGADVTLWKLTAENGFVPDVAELEALVRPNTKMIIINNPNNPTGASIPRSVFFVPGSKCFGDGGDFKGYVRIGYVCHTEVLKEGLEKLGGYLEAHFK
ncbi:hypothetical protein VdG1_03332 [Verticillium dahliae VDG1]|nr:hypothetical protein VdG1_03332 [Verticillium dahliae VDG1]